jgi:N-acetylmuramic acid 6-phosphate etherase
MILNMISTTAFILCGKTYGNLMVDVCPTNEKLVARAMRIICTTVECSEDAAGKLLESSGRNVKTAIVMGLLGCTAEAARVLLDSHRGRIRDAVGNQ